jgi:hypothetical protein
LPKWARSPTPHPNTSMPPHSATAARPRTVACCPRSSRRSVRCPWRRQARLADAVEQLARGRLEATSHAHEGGEADVPLMTGREALTGVASAAGDATSSKAPADAAARRPRTCRGMKRARQGLAFFVHVGSARGSRTLQAGTSCRPRWRSALLRAAGIRSSGMTSDSWGLIAFPFVETPGGWAALSPGVARGPS